MEKYMEYKERTAKELEEFPIAFAFSNKQLEEAVKKLGVTVDECCSVSGGGIIRRKDTTAFCDLFARHAKELVTLMKDDAFLTEAIRYELGNHEFCITGDPDDALSVLDLNFDDLDARQVKCYRAAKAEYLENCNY